MTQTQKYGNYVLEWLKKQNVVKIQFSEVVFKHWFILRELNIRHIPQKKDFSNYPNVVVSYFDALENSQNQYKCPCHYFETSLK